MAEREAKSNAQSRTATEAAVGRCVRPEIQALTAYPVPDPGTAIKLDAMESPWPWPDERLTAAWLERLRAVPVNRYPDAAANALKGQLRTHFELPAACDLIVGNGSDELIQLINLAVAGSAAGAGRTVLAPAPSFAMYRIIATLTGADYAEVELDDGFDVDRAAWQSAHAKYRPAVTYFAHPNNPTGNGLDLDALAAYAEQAEGLVVIDEAYYAYAESSFLPRLTNHPNVVVLRTLSKVGLAGLRIGVLIGHPAWLEQFEKCRLPYNVGSLAQASATFALEQRALLDEAVERIRSERTRLAAALAAHPRTAALLPSETNFLTFRVAGMGAAELHRSLFEQGVLVKSLAGSHPRLADCLRVTVGRPEENDRFLAALPR
ncbi:histidinol-phosphate transaminase [Halorhodospira abdelmalekii]|uniref:histidinol-phosphate transaminase n=1 Tax=Halorhodospira abdelmalekii TaxID=421629 RepID=UPI0019067CE8|nr:histidinol-phosphate transaminase [Halorhodospira abdelmalekii]